MSEPRGRALDVCIDSHFLHALIGSVDIYSHEKIVYDMTDFHYLRSKDEKKWWEEIEKGWKKVGVKAKILFQFEQKGECTIYYQINDEYVTKEQARKFAMEFTNHYMNDDEWMPKLS